MRLHFLTLMFSVQFQCFNVFYLAGSYVYHREGRFVGKFFCLPHSTENALEKYKIKKKIDEIHATEMRRKEISKKEEKKKEKIKNAISPGNWQSNVGQHLRGLSMKHLLIYPLRNLDLNKLMKMGGQIGISETAPPIMWILVMTLYQTWRVMVSHAHEMR